MEHIPITHKNCDRLYCPVCEGGLFICEICGLSEGSLTTHCPGERVPYEIEQRIYNQGNLDYRAHTGWIEAPNPTHQWWEFGRRVQKARRSGASNEDIDRLKNKWAKELPVLRKCLEVVK